MMGDKKSKSTASLKPAAIAETRAHYRPVVCGCGTKVIAAALHLPVGSVAHVCDRVHEAGVGEARPRGRKLLLSEAEERRVSAWLATHPFATNAELAAVVHDRVKPRMCLPAVNLPSHASASLCTIPKSSHQRGRPKCVRSVMTPSAIFHGACGVCR